MKWLVAILICASFCELCLADTQKDTLIISEDPKQYEPQKDAEAPPIQILTEPRVRKSQPLINKNISRVNVDAIEIAESDTTPISHPMLHAIYALWALIIMLVAISKRGLRYLHFFQQEEYNSKRFISWWWINGAMDKRHTAVMVLAFLCFHFDIYLPGVYVGSFANWILPGVFMLLIALLENDPRHHGKIKLNLTARATRIMWTSRVLLLLLLSMTYLSWYVIFNQRHSALWLLSIAAIQLSPFTFPMAAWLLSPQEKRTQRKYLNEAKAKLEQVKPHVIGITGSYGKTSTKVILADLMEAVAPTFFPPKSINTQMGIVRQIREHLNPQHQYAIIEMGAYQKGSIAKLCNLTPPTTGIVTAVGIMHLERFGSEEAVFEAKRELPEAVIAGEQPLVLCNADDPGSLRMGEWCQQQKTGKGEPVNTFFYGLDTGADKLLLNCEARDIQLTSLDENNPDDPLNWGTRFKLHHRPGPDVEAVYDVAVPLLGKAMLSNYLAAFSCAVLMGGHPKALVAQSRLVKHAEHRLQLKRVRDGRHGGYVLLDDAYNANPSGFIAAIDVLAKLPARRRWLVTPGMVELGDKQFEENKRAASYAMRPVAGKPVIDEVIIVGDTNRAAFAQSMSSLGERLHLVDQRDKAHEYLFEYARPEDVVLWANDLPDLYEAKPKF